MSNKEEIEEIKAEIEDLEAELVALRDEYETGSFYGWDSSKTWGEPPDEHFRSRDELSELISETESRIEELEEELEELEA